MKTIVIGVSSAEKGRVQRGSDHDPIRPGVCHAAHV